LVNDIAACVLKSSMVRLAIAATLAAYYFLMSVVVAVVFG
jgi:hypothetical protein